MERQQHSAANVDSADSVILCECARFKNFNSPAAAVQLNVPRSVCPHYATRIRKQSSLLFTPSCVACFALLSLLQAKSFSTCGWLWKRQINFAFPACFSSIFALIFVLFSLTCSHKMFALFGACCLLLLQATMTPAQVSLACITCLHFQKVDRPASCPPVPPLAVCNDQHLLVNSYGRLVCFVYEISQIFPLSRWFCSQNCAE